MSSIFDIISLGMSPDARENQIVACNSFSSEYGLTLTKEQAHDLEISHKQLLSEYNRVEFGTPGTIQVIEGFASSPYLLQEQYADTLEELQEQFYQLRSQAGVDIFDEEIIDGMRLRFDGDAGGATELLGACTLEMVLEAYDTQTGSLEERQREVIPDMTQTTEVPTFLDDVSQVNPKVIEEGLKALDEAAQAPVTSPWDPSEWVDDIMAPGFDGERWEDDYK